MKKSVKIALILALILILVGGFLFVGASTEAHWDFESLKLESFEMNKYSPQQPIKSIVVETDAARVSIQPSQDGAVQVKCYEHIKAKHLVAVEGETLSIQLQDTRKWYDHIGISLQTPEITIYLPKEAYESLAVRNDTGDISIGETFEFQTIEIEQSTGDTYCQASASKGMTVRTETGEITLKDGKIGALEVEVSTGDATLENLSCKSLRSVGDTGDITLKNTIAEEKISIERETGRVRLWDCDAAEIFVKTDTGDVRGTLLTEKIIFAETETGSVRIPESMQGGKCKIITDTGDIDMEYK